MRILTVNCGSSSLKIEVWQIDAGGAAQVQLRSGVDGVGGGDAGYSITTTRGNGSKVEGAAQANDYAEAARFLVNRLVDSGLLRLREIDGVGHRIVHGGTRFVAPTLVNERSRKRPLSTRRFTRNRAAAAATYGIGHGIGAVIN